MRIYIVGEQIPQEVTKMTDFMCCKLYLECLYVRDYKQEGSCKDARIYTDPMKFCDKCSQDHLDNLID